MTEPTTKQIREAYSYRSDAEAHLLCGLAERLDASERRCAELRAELEEVKHEAAYWESEACHGRS